MAGLKSLKKQRRIQVIVLAFVALAGSTALIGYGLQDGINFFRSPSQVATDPPKPGEIFRLGGLVEEGSLRRGQSETIEFTVTDTKETVPVRFTGLLPDLFGEGEGMVGTGQMEGEIFVATEILAKHDETYMPKEVMDALKAQGVYKEPES